MSIPSSPKYILDTPTHATVGKGVRLVFFSGVDNEEQPKKKVVSRNCVGLRSPKKTGGENAIWIGAAFLLS